MRERYTDKQRRALVALVSSGQARVFEAADRLGVNRASGYAWMREARKTPGRRDVDDACPAFARLVPGDRAPAAVTVRVDGVEIDVRHGFDGALLRAVLDAVKGGAA